MARYRVDGPDGQSYQVEGPENASRESILQALQYHLHPAPPPPELSGPESSTAGAGFRGIERGAAPGVGAFQGVGIGAELGSFAGPVGTLAGGILGGLGGATAISAAQEAVLKHFPSLAKALGQDEQQRAADIEQHPWASRIGEALPQFAGMRPSMAPVTAIRELMKSGASDAAKLAAKEILKESAKNSAIGAGMMTGLDLGQQSINDQPWDARSALIAAATGALSTKKTALGEALENQGATWGKRLLGRELPTDAPVPPLAPEATAPDATAPDATIKPSKKKTKKVAATNAEAEAPPSLGDDAFFPAAPGAAVEPEIPPSPTGATPEGVTAATPEAAPPPEIPPVQPKAATAGESTPVAPPEIPPVQPAAAPAVEPTVELPVEPPKINQPWEPEATPLTAYFGSAKTAIREAGNASPQTILNALKLEGADVKLKDARAIRDALVESGDLVKEKGKYVLKESSDEAVPPPEEAAPGIGKPGGDVPPVNEGIGASPAAPVQPDIAPGPSPDEAPQHGMDSPTGDIARPDGGATGIPPALEVSPAPTEGFRTQEAQRIADDMAEFKAKKEAEAQAKVKKPYKAKKTAVDIDPEEAARKINEQYVAKQAKKEAEANAEREALTKATIPDAKVEPPVEVAKPVEPTAIEGESDQHPAWAKEAEQNAHNAEVVYSNKNLALLRGYDRDTGEAVYAGMKNKPHGALRNEADISAIDSTHENSLFTPIEHAELLNARDAAVTRDKAAQENSPDGPFKGKEGQVVASKGVDVRNVAYTKNLLQSVGLGHLRVFLIHPEELMSKASRDSYNLNHEYRTANIAGSTAAEEGSTSRFGPKNKDVYISIRQGLSPELTIGKIAHEVGHNVMKFHYAKAPAEVRSAIDAEYRKWAERTPAMTKKQHIRSMRTYAEAAHADEILTDTARFSARDRDRYWSTFPEWFADQTARWATTSARPLTIVEKFFSELGKKLRNLAKHVLGRDYLPKPVMEKYLNSLGVLPAEEFVHTPKKPVLSIKKGEQSSKSLSAVANQPVLKNKRIPVPPEKTPTAEETIESLGKRDNIDKNIPRNAFQRAKDYVNHVRKIDYEESVRLLEDRQRVFTSLDRKLMNAGVLDKTNSIGQAAKGYASLSRQTYESQAAPLVDRLHTAIAKYAKAAGLSVTDAVKRLHGYMVALHEPERRAMLFAAESPLSRSKKYTLPNGTTIPASDLREQIFKKMHAGKKDPATGETIAYSKAELKTFRDILNHITDKKNGFLEANTGHSPSGKKSDNVHDASYNVAGKYSQEALEAVRKMHDADKHTAEIADVKQSLKDLQEKTVELNRAANYWSAPVDNFRGLYNYQNYVPLKGNPNANAFRYDYADKRLSGAFSQYERKAEGRQTDSNNSLIQSMTDAARAADRTGRSNVTKVMRNLIEQGHIKGKHVEKINFMDRYQGADRLAALQKRRNFFSYNKDGSFDVYKIDSNDIRYLEALKGEVQDNNGVLQKTANALRPLTTGMGRFHTIFSPAFAPMNYARHLITNSLKISSEKGTQTLPKFWVDALANTVSGKMFTSMKLYRDYMKGNISDMAAAPAGSFKRQAYEYLSNGGNTEISQALSDVGNIRNLTDSAKKINGNFQVGVEKIGDALKTWTHGFEITNRVTSYGILKQEALKALAKQGLSGQPLELAAQSRAASEAKNLLNFQNVGVYGRDLSAFFMFYRANATGAVAALDAIRPAFVSKESYMASLPDSIKGNSKLMANAEAAFMKQKASARLTLLFTTGAGFAIHQIAQQMAGNDEQGRNIVATDDMNQWGRNMRFPASFFGERSGNAFVQMPWGYGIGSLGAVGAQISGALAGHTLLKDTLWNSLNSLRESFFPVPTAQFNPTTDGQTALKFVVDSITPTPFRPIVEAALNVDTFGREVVPTHINKYGDVYSGGEAVPEIYKDVARGLMAHGGIEVAPSTVQFVVSNYVDGLARFAQSAHADYQTVSGNADFDPKRSLATTPFANFIGKKTSVDAREFADAEREIIHMRSVINMFKASGRGEQLSNYLEKHPSAMPLVQVYDSQVNNGIKKMRGLIAQIEASDMTPAEKKAPLKDIKDGLHMMQRGFLDFYDQVKE